MKIKNVSSVWGYLRFFRMVMAIVLVLSGSIVLAQKLVDLNAASEKELESIKGVGPATAKKIVAGRPYQSVDELSKSGLSTKQIEAIKPFVTVGTGGPAAPPKDAPAKATTSATAKPAQPEGKVTAPTQQPPVKGMVWVNLNTKVYHVEGDPYYGKTKKGEWMTEEDAIKKGFHKSKRQEKKK